MAAEALRRTPLYEEHKALGARLVDFAGWEMPVQYAGIKAEHQAVRNDVGLFDVSHMGEVVFRGPQAEEAAVCYEDGGTVDDVLVYRRAGDFLIVVNASNREKDFEHFRANTQDLDVEITDESDDWVLLALQGPRAIELLQPFTNTDLSVIRYYHFAEGEVGISPVVLSRTGYTGEDGFEIFARPSDAPSLWKRLVEAGATPAGLGAPATLRP